MAAKRRRGNSDVEVVDGRELMPKAVRTEQLVRGDLNR
jgi:hypothetical protein